MAISSYATYGGSASQVVDYYYDADNRWIAETIDSDGDGQIDRTLGFVYDGDQIALQFESSSPLPLGEGQGEGSALTNADLSHRYLWQANAVDQLLADEALSPLPLGEGQGEGGEGGSDGYDLTVPGDVLFALTDHLGTVRDLATNDSGITSIANHRVYDSFGNLTSETNAAVDCLFGFTGRAYDENSGLQNNLNRWYDSKVGRWASEDPIGFNGSDANLYRYVGNGVTYATDSTGLQKPPTTDPNRHPIMPPPYLVPPYISLPFNAIKWLANKGGSFVWDNAKTSALLDTIVKSSSTGTPASTGRFKDSAWKFFGTWINQEEDLKKWCHQLVGTSVGNGWIISGAKNPEPWITWWVRYKENDVVVIDVQLVLRITVTTEWKSASGKTHTYGRTMEFFIKMDTIRVKPDSPYYQYFRNVPPA